jgi:DNA-binding winged helix-turn-helix (wHTH) protein
MLHFGDFRLDPVDRRLWRGETAAPLNARYFDALLLLVDNAGTLVTKDRFMADIWSGVPVTDEALTQCIRTLRRELGDDAARPRFIQTEPKFGYRFIAAVERAPIPAAAVTPSSDHAGVWPVNALPRIGSLAAAGAIGGGLAGVVGGLGYGLLLAAQPGAAPGQISILLVMISLCMLVGLAGGAGVGAGVSRAWQAPAPGLLGLIAGGAAGGAVVGALVQFLGADAFSLLVGRAPVGMAGAGEGLAVGAAIGLALWQVQRGRTLRRGLVAAAFTGMVAGVLITLAGGRLMASSLAAMTRQFPDARLDLAPFEAMGMPGSYIVGGIECAMFAVGVTLAMTVAKRDQQPA